MAGPKTQTQRGSGVLLHLSSLPGRYGTGDMGPAAYRWIDLLAQARQLWWQILPLGPPGDGGSPYQCYSAFAGNPNLISPELLLQEGLIGTADARRASFPETRIDFARVISFKTALLAKAWEKFRAGSKRPLRAAFEKFCSTQADWLDDYALFMAIRESRPGVAWTEWPKELVRRKPAGLAAARKELRDAVDRNRFIQFLFFQQWAALREHARKRGVRLIGDLPIFVSGDSADVWAHADQFLLDKNRQPKVVAGVPPDYFSETGQRWGNPLYDWRAMRRDVYAWWVARAKGALAQTDWVRIDHFRGFAAAWNVPADQPTAKKGKWVKGPGEDLFRAFQKKLGGLPFIAEDLGVITPDVEKLRDDFALPGMRVLQFAFDGGPGNPFLPHHYPCNSVAYTGTHDNDTTVGWFASLTKQQRAAVTKYVPAIAKDPAGELMRLAWSSIAQTAIAPLQDILSLDSACRMNIPGTATGNWGWRVTAKQLKPAAFERLAELTETYGRAAS